MAKAIFERSDDSFAGKPVTTTPVRSVKKAKKSGPGSFTVKSAGGEDKAKVVPGADRTTVYKKLGDDEGYPRGYNPQQMQEVQQAETTGRIRIRSNSRMEDGRKHSEHEVMTAKENLARSRVRPMELPDTGRLDVQIYKGVGDPAFHRAEGGSHIGKGKQDREIHAEPTSIDNSILIHEMGHDAHWNDPEALGYKEEAGAAVGSGPKRLGIFRRGAVREHRERVREAKIGYGEGYAEAYSAENYVPDPRSKEEPKESAYQMRGLVGPYTADRKSRARAFAVGYRRAGGPMSTPTSPAVTTALSQFTNVPDQHIVMDPWTSPYTRADLKTALRNEYPSE